MLFNVIVSFFGGIMVGAGFILFWIGADDE